MYEQPPGLFVVCFIQLELEAPVIQIRRSALVRYTPAQMYELVSDVEAYPKRFHWCERSHVSEQEGDTLVARMDLRFAGLHQSFTTRNKGQPPEHIRIGLVEGPFKTLEGVWTFDALGDKGCRVGLELDFEHAGRLGGLALKLGFQGLAGRMVDDFCSAARRIYG